MDSMIIPTVTRRSQIVGSWSPNWRRHSPNRTGGRRPTFPRQTITESPLVWAPPQPDPAVRRPPCASRRPPSAAQRSRRGRAASLPSAHSSIAKAWREKRGRRCSRSLRRQRPDSESSVTNVCRLSCRTPDDLRFVAHLRPHRRCPLGLSSDRGQIDPHPRREPSGDKSPLPVSQDSKESPSPIRKVRPTEEMPSLGTSEAFLWSWTYSQVCRGPKRPEGKKSTPGKPAWPGVSSWPPKSPRCTIPLTDFAPS